MLNAGDIEILRQAAATADEIALLEAELRGSSLMVAGYAGQPRPNPLLKIIQDHRLLLRRLVDSLALPDEDQESGLRPGSRHARSAARGRWKESNRVPTNGKLAELRGAEYLMATHRRPPLTVAPPPKLLSFDPTSGRLGSGGSR